MAFSLAGVKAVQSALVTRLSNSADHLTWRLRSDRAERDETPSKGRPRHVAPNGSSVADKGHNMRNVVVFVLIAGLFSSSAAARQARSGGAAGAPTIKACSLVPKDLALKV